MIQERIIEAKAKATTIIIETARIEGALLAIRDLAGFEGARAAANAALRRVCRASNDNDGWIG